MNIIDIAVVLLILIFGILGFKRGFFKQTVMTIGAILVFVFAYYFKDYVANFLSYNLPFFNFKGQFAGLSSLNIALYQMIAFIIMLGLFSAILAILIKLSGLIEKILKMTVILSIPSKILGLLVGLLEGYIIVFIALFILNQPFINLKMVKESKLMPTIVKTSPGLSHMVKKTEKSVVEIYELGKNYLKNKDPEEFNQKSIDVMLKNKIITVKYVERLIDKNKIDDTGIEEILVKYR